MKRLFLLLLLAAVLLPTGVAQATPPVTCTGEFVPTYSEVRDIRYAGGNMIMIEYNELTFTGCLEGIYAGEERIVVHPDGRVTAQGTYTFTGVLILESGEPLSGSYISNQIGQGEIPLTFAVRATILSGTGDFANLRGTAEGVGDFATSSGTYAFGYHLDP